MCMTTNTTTATRVPALPQPTTFEPESAWERYVRVTLDFASDMDLGYWNQLVAARQQPQVATQASAYSPVSDLVHGTGTTEVVEVPASQPKARQPLSDEYHAAVAFLRGYTGTFEFLTKCQRLVRNGRPLTDNQVAAVLRCAARETPKAAVAPVAAPVAAASAQAAPVAPAVFTVPAGHYAVPGADGALRFVRVDRPAKGAWTGWAFVKVQASDELHKLGAAKPGEGYRGKGADLVAAIEADPEGAGLRYGQEIGRCCRCNRTLTDETSRALGIGPECRSKGW